ncbi:MAG: hypothetical protein KBD37_04525 [Burkholderiales bacterium]|nr:hypothetical protein [Burkholderiales bacterium]
MNTNLYPLRLKNILTGFIILLITCNIWASPVPNSAATSASANKHGVTTPNHPFPQFENISPYILADGTQAIYPTGSGITPNSRKIDVENYYNLWKQNYITTGPTYDGHTTYRVRLGKVEDKSAQHKTKVGQHNNRIVTYLFNKSSGKKSNEYPLSDITVSEGQGYGMIITVMMAGFDPQAQQIFDGLFRYVKAYPSKLDDNLMSWIITPANDAGHAANNSAFDGDADIALALVLASQQWNSSPNGIDYMAEAKTIIASIKNKTIGPDSHLPMLGDWVTSGKYNQWAPRSSDFMLDNFRVFGFIDPTQHAYWEQVINSSHAAINHIQTQYSANTGLLPDFTQNSGNSINAIQPAPADYLEDEYDGDYAYNAARTPWRIGADALLNRDATSLAQVRKMSNWIKTHSSNNIDNIYSGYHLNGNDIGEEYNSSLFTAPFGVAAMTVTNGGSTQQKWLKDIYTAVKKFDNDEEDYYEHTISMLSLLIMTGNYWNPATFEDNKD